MSSTEPPAPSSREVAYDSNLCATAEQACKECRRRKSRCDRIIPICALCHKFGRQCIYERSDKTPLTRRYLTEVESELARTKELLQRFMPEPEYSREINFSRPVERADNPSHAANIPPAPSLNNSEPAHGGRSEPAVPTASSDLRPQQFTPSRVNNVNGISHLSIQHPPGHHGQQQQRSPSDRRSLGPSALSLETPPSSSNFEWDERNGNAAGGKFIDGMASLTSNSNEGGYLGK